MGKERFKTLLLTVLFILSLGLTQQLWMGVPAAEILPSTKTVENNDNNETNTYDMTTLMMNVISPQGFTVNFGGGYHTVFFSDGYNIWLEAIPILSAYFNQEVVLEEITQERWISINDFRSVRLDFDYDMPLSVLKTIVQGKDMGLAGKISTLRSIVIPVTEEGTLYIGNSIENKYYRVKIDQVDGDIAEVIRAVEENGFDHYFAIKDIMGGENNTLMPIELNENIPKIKVVQEMDPSNMRQIEPIAGTFFGENFDFVRKITETSGAVIYMYGYGQKTLKVDASGILEYNEEVDNQRLSSSVELSEALRIAVRFVTEHADWPKDAYLKEIIEKDKKKSYIFIFGYRINGLPVHFYEKIVPAPIEVEVTGRQVTRYRRYVKREKIDVSFLEKLDNDKILSPQQILDKNFEDIKSLFIRADEENKRKEEKELLREILSSIYDVKLGYYDQPMGERDKLIPIWIMKVNNYLYYFDAYKGTILNRSEL